MLIPKELLHFLDPDECNNVIYYYKRDNAGSRLENHAESEIMIADGAYGVSENQKLAEFKNTELITTALAGKALDKIYSGVTFTEDGK